MYRVFRDLLQPSAVQMLVELAGKGQFVDGRVTAPGIADDTKRNEQVRPDAEIPARIGRILGDSLRTSEEFASFTMPQRFHHPPTISRYKPGMYYGRHLDHPVMGVAPKVRTDFSMTVFLSAPETYDGGELVLELESGELQVKLEAGSAVVYDSGVYHRVAEVTRGERLVIVTWIQSFIGDPRRRQIIRDLHDALTLARSVSADPRITELVHVSVNNLYRMWATAV